nr:peptidyl-prolyl cis-trans isomerase [Gemmatimonadota bacterium]
MKQFRLDILAVAAPLLLSACGSFGKAMTAHTDVVARAAGHELKVRDAAQLLSTYPEIPADPQMVEALADLWIDYTLLVTASAGDTSLSALDINQLIAPDREQAIIWKLRQQVVHPDTTFTDAEVIQAWSTEGPGAEIRARHILLNLPAEATPAQRDSVRRLAEELRGRAAAGADFPALAEQYSGDQGSAAQGGDLGFFGRGRMVAPFEEAAFQLGPGEISPVVESPFGYHIIRLEERRQQELGDQLPSFRQFLSQRATQNAEQAYIDQLTESANVQVT